MDMMERRGEKKRLQHPDIEKMRERESEKEKKEE